MTAAVFLTAAAHTQSTLTTQVAPAVALKHPDKQVLLLDLSIQGDASVLTLGGTAPPLVATAGIRTRGAEVVASLPNNKSAVSFLAAAKAFASAGGGGAPTTRSTTRGGGFGGAAPQAFNWEEYCVKVSAVFPAGKAPANLWVCPPGGTLNDFMTVGEVVDYATALRAAFASMGKGVIVIIDTDAELSERAASRLAIASARNLGLVVTSSWMDYQRVLDDKVNSLFLGLSWLADNDPGCVSKIDLVVFNNVQLYRKDSVEVCGTAGALPFTPPVAAKTNIVDVVNHLYEMCGPPTNFKQYFNDLSAFGSVSTFTKRYVTGVATVADSVWSACTAAGSPVVVKSPGEGSAAQLSAVASAMAQRLFI